MLLETALICMQMAIYQEARSESLIGQLLVAETIMNRVDQNSNRYGKTVCEVVKKPKQFSFYNDITNDNQLKVNEPNAWDVAGRLAKKSLTGTISYGTGCHYNTTTISPNHTKKYKVYGVEGNHIFFLDC